jgi:hypothetical protein
MNYKLRVEQDDDPMSPREWDNVGTIVAEHRRYNLSDEGAPRIDWADFSGWDEVEQHLKDECGAIAVLPVYLYDHSGLAISTSPFGCPWDSGRVGAIYATAERVVNMLGTDVDEEAILQALRGEVTDYDQCLRGDIWCFVIEDGHGNVVDSCGGFYGREDATENGEAALRYCIENAPKPCAQPAPACIRGKATCQITQ